MKGISKFEEKVKITPISSYRRKDLENATDLVVHYTNSVSTNPRRFKMLGVDMPNTRRIEGEYILYLIKRQGKFLKAKNKKIHYHQVNNESLRYQIGALRSLKKMCVK